MFRGSRWPRRRLPGNERPIRIDGILGVSLDDPDLDEIPVFPPQGGEEDNQGE